MNRLLLPLLVGLTLCLMPTVAAAELTGRQAQELLRQAATAAASGDQTTAARVWAELLPWVRRHAPPGSAMLPQSLLQVGDLQSSQGLLQQAERTYQEALQLARSLPEPRPLLVAILLNNLADLYADLDRFAEARALLQESLQQKIAVLGAAHLEVGIAHSNFGDLLHEMGELNLAEQELARSLAVLQPLSAQYPLAMAAALNNLSRLQQQRGAWDQARQALDQAQQLRLKVLPQTHPDLALGWNNLGMLALSRGDLTAAQSHLQRAYLQTRQIHGDAHHLTAIQIANLARLDRELGRDHQAIQRLQQAQRILDAELGSGHPDSLHNLAELLLLQHRTREVPGLRGPLDMLLRKRFALFADEAWRLQPRERLLLLRRRDPSWYLADALTTTDPGAAPLAVALRLNTQGLLQELQREQRLSTRRADPVVPRRWIEPSEVAAALPASSVLIELRRYLDPASIPQAPEVPLPWRYRAYVLSGIGGLQVVDLGPASKLEPLIRQAYIASAEQLSDAPDRWASVSSVLLNPLRAAAGDATAWFIVPDAGLHQVPFQALVPDRSLRLLSSGRELLRLNHRNTQPTPGSPVVAGNPAISIPLPSTAVEAQGVARLLGVTPVDGSRFSAAMLSKLSRPLVLHLATHGFWDAKQAGQPVRMADPDPSHDPMLRSGIVVSPAKGATDRFSAADFLGLDLSNTELVTLSGCSTGLGDLHDSEGIYGLLRGVQVAGARSVLTSLWPVDDAATSDWMLRFYGYLSQGRGRADALAAVQADFRSHPNALWRHPYYWAGWQLVGDWRPIQGLRR